MQSPEEVPSASGEFVSLEKGMSANRVRALMGEPLAIRPMIDAQAAAEVWVYARSTIVSTDQVQGGNIEEVFIDPMTGETKMIPSSQHAMEQTVLDRVIELLMYNGALTEWKSMETRRRVYR